MASSRTQAKGKSQRHKTHSKEVEEDERRSCGSRIGWICTKLFQFTFGACCYAPIAVCFSLCRICNDVRSPPSDEELMSYAHYVQPNSARSTVEDEQEWKRRTKIIEADTRVKQRLKYQFQDHIQKWMDIKHRRFPWKATLHLLLVILVTIQVCMVCISISDLCAAVRLAIHVEQPM